jgi:hypothetical protein
LLYCPLCFLFFTILFQKINYFSSKLSFQVTFELYSNPPLSLCLYFKTKTKDLLK